MSSSLVLGLGVSLGLFWVAWSAPRKQASRSVEAGMAALLGGMLAGRLGYVLLHWVYYQAHPAEIPQVWLGGFSGLSAALGGLTALWLFARLTRASLSILADALLPLGAVMVVAGWLVGWMDGCAYGREVLTWGLIAPDEWGDWASRFPIWLVGVVSTMLFFYIIEHNRHKLHYPGQAAALGFLSIALQLFLLSLLRVDPVRLILGLRLDTWGALVLVSIAVVYMISRYLYHKD